MKTKRHFNSKKSPSKARNIHFRPLALAIALAFSVSTPNIAQATTYIVNNTNDTGFGSLRRAVDDANNVTPGVADTIEFTIPAGSTINLASELSITDSVTIKGPVEGDASSIILDGGELVRHINAGGFPSSSGQTITLENITLQNGFFDGTTVGFGGGSVFVKYANIVLNHCVLSNNSTSGNNVDGGGLFVQSGNATLNHSTISGNSTMGNGSKGGGLFVLSGNTTLNHTIISGNTSAMQGGGGYLRLGVISINQSTVSSNNTSSIPGEGGGLFLRGISEINETTISHNSAKLGGGIFSAHSNIILKQSTISNNSATNNGGGLVLAFGKTTLIQTTVTNNTSNTGAGGLVVSMLSTYNTTTLINTILSGNTGPDGNFVDVATTPADLLKATNSLFGDPAIEITDPSSSANYYSNAPDLGPLQHNGGITQTHKPNAASPAFDKGSNTEAVAFSNDQRGNSFPRIHNGLVDIGAIELQNNTIAGDPLLNPDEILTRRDMAREMLKQSLGVNYTPPPATGNIFADVKIGDINADWIEDFYAKGYTEGCATNKFCPNGVVTRAEMSKIAVKLLNGSAYTPPPQAQATYNDVPQGHPFNIWVEQLLANNMTAGCAMNRFCPDEPVTRIWFTTSILPQF